MEIKLKQKGLLSDSFETWACAVAAWSKTLQGPSVKLVCSSISAMLY